MTRARDIANLVDANGDIVAGALDNVPAADLVNDTTPQLGGALDGQLNNITNTGDISLGTNSPNTSKNIRLYGDESRIEFHNGGAYTVGVSGGAAIRFHRPSSGHEGIDFETHNTGVTHQAMLKVHPEGYITKPRQPSFEVRRTGGGINVGSTYTNYSATSLQHNFGGHYNTSTYRFVVPIAGVYFFYFWSIQNSMSTGALQIRVNGSAVSFAHATTSSSNWGTTTLPLTRSLSANDYVEAFWANPNGQFHGSPYTAFGGYLMG